MRNSALSQVKTLFFKKIEQHGKMISGWEEQSLKSTHLQNKNISKYQEFLELGF